MLLALDEERQLERRMRRDCDETSDLSYGKCGPVSLEWEDRTFDRWTAYRKGGGIFRYS